MQCILWQHVCERALQQQTWCSCQHFTAACRTCNNPFVVKEPHLRFYCSAPLVASNGHRIGTM